MATINERQSKRAASINLDDDDEIADLAPYTSEPKTAPGQLMNLQGKYAQAQEEIERLKREGGNSGALLVRISDTYIVEGRQRRLTSVERDELKTNLQENGQLEPAVVLPRNERGYEFIIGHNRRELLQELGHESILVTVKEVDPGKVDVVAFYSNLLAPSLPDYSKFVGLKKRQVETNFTLKQLESESGILYQSISLLFNFEKLPDEARKILDEHPKILGATAAAKLAQATLAGRGKLVVEALRIRSENEKFTEANVVAHANKISAPARKPLEPVVIKSGRKHFCEITTRSGHISVKFNDPNDASTWEKKLEEFVRSELKKEKSGEDIGNANT